MPRKPVGKRVLEEIERIISGSDEQFEVLAGCVVLDGNCRLVGALAPEEGDVGGSRVTQGEHLWRQLHKG
jgi:hypothetical protein